MFFSVILFNIELSNTKLKQRQQSGDSRLITIFFIRFELVIKSKLLLEIDFKKKKILFID